MKSQVRRSPGYSSDTAALLTQETGVCLRGYVQNCRDGWPKPKAHGRGDFCFIYDAYQVTMPVSAITVPAAQTYLGHLGYALQAAEAPGVGARSNCRM